MTKKNLAALMLAGAMMTVGSGAMAADFNANVDAGTVAVPIQYTAVESVNITISWNTLTAFEYEWSDTAWQIKTGADTRQVAFTATNNGSNTKNITMAAPAVTDNKWIDEITGTGSKTSVASKAADTPVGTFTIKAKSTPPSEATVNTDTAQDATTLNFTATIE